MNHDPDFSGCPLNFNSRDAGLGEPFLDGCPELQIFNEEVPEILVGKPPRIPGSRDSEPKAERMYLSVPKLLLQVVTGIVDQSLEIFVWIVSYPEKPILPSKPLECDLFAF